MFNNNIFFESLDSNISARDPQLSDGFLKAIVLKVLQPYDSEVKDYHLNHILPSAVDPNRFQPYLILNDKDIRNIFSNG